ncbi:MAG TPA: hypothetical protein PKK26_04415 [Candidatus Wallbacteria bacterium]|nr:hypothetical protein [Candidatus Wallbacteria bacterium]
MIMKIPQKTKFVCAALLTLSLLLPAVSTGAERKKNSGARELRIGFVDLSILMAFHPLMQYYSIDYDIFIKPLKKGLNKQELLNEVAERQQKNKNFNETSGGELKNLQQELGSIEAEITKLRVGVSREQDVINREYTEEYTGLQSEAEKKTRTQKYRNALSDIDSRYYSAKKKYDDRKAQINDRVSEISHSNHKIDYLDKKAGLEILNEIAVEINTALKDVAAENQIDVVLNSSAIHPFTPPKDIKPENYMREDPYSPNAAIAEVYSGKLFENTDGLEAGKNTDGISENCKEVYTKRGAFVESIMRKGIAMYSNRMFAHGGEDLTIKVLEKILRSYSVPQAKMDIMTKAITKSRNVDYERTHRVEEEEVPAQN